tara:strand:+ start:42488 stop:43090 length:603 start_codon:yes stop_codon:yes gene_type:complete
MQVNDILIIISVCFLGAITPGPSLLIILGITINKGRKEAIKACIGHALGICFYAFIVVMGLAILIEEFNKIFILVQKIGCIFIIYLGIIFLNSSDDIENTNKTIHVNSFVSGLAIAILNPKVIIFFSSIFSQFIDYNITFEKIIIFTSIATLIDFIVYSLIVIFIALTIKSETIFKNLKQINMFSGCTLIMLGLILFIIV